MSKYKSRNNNQVHELTAEQHTQITEVVKASSRDLLTKYHGSEQVLLHIDFLNVAYRLGRRSMMEDMLTFVRKEKQAEKRGSKIKRMI